MDRGGELLHLRAVGDIDELGEHIATEATSLVLRRRQAGLVDVAEREARASTGTEQRRLTSDSAARAGDQRELAVHSLDIHQRRPYRPPRSRSRS